MTSIVLLMTFPIIAIQVTMLGAQIWPPVLSHQIIVEFLQNQGVRESHESVEVIKEECPYIENGEYALTTKCSYSEPISGCGYIKYNSSDGKPQIFSLYLEDRFYQGPHCKERGFEHVHYYCLSKAPSEPLYKMFTEKGRMFLKHEWQNNSTEGHICAVYEKSLGFLSITLRIAISKDSTCDGLSNVLKYPEDSDWDSNVSRLITFKFEKTISQILKL